MADRKQLNIRLTEDQHQRLAEVTAVLGMSASEACRQAVTAWIDDAAASDEFQSRLEALTNTYKND